MKLHLSYFQQRICLESTPALTRWAITGLVIATLNLSTGCAQNTVAQSPAPATTRDSTPAQPLPRNYSAETLSDILLAEVAAQRNELEFTLEKYVAQARETRQALLAEQAGALASYMNDPELALEMADIWLQAQPTNPNAMHLAAVQHILLGQTDQAADYIGRMLAHNADDAILRMVIEARELGQQGNQTLITALGSLAEQFPERGELWYMKALHQHHQQDFEGALASIRHSIDLRPTHLDSKLFHAQLLHQHGETAKSLRLLKKITAQHPRYKRGRTLYIRILLEAGRLDDAADETASLLKLFPQDHDLKLALALNNIETGATDTARALLYELLASGFRTHDVHLYLGRLEEREQHLSTAINHYLSVDGPQRIRARAQAARLYHQQGEHDQAENIMAMLREKFPEQRGLLLLTEANIYSASEDYDRALKLVNLGLSEDPDSPDLLYSRAMISEKQDNLGQLEADLLRMLEQDPDNATALNALGYTLADRTDRIEEAYDYISKAYAQRPDDPAIIDSMGWVLYRMGELERAATLLEQAFNMTRNHEIAAHYGEVLWVQGKHKEAQRIWEAGLQDKPDSKIILQTRDRLSAQVE